MDFFKLSDSLLLFKMHDINSHHFIYFLVLERVNLGRVSHWSAVLAYRAGSVLLKKFVSWHKFECGKAIDVWIDQRTYRITKIYRGQSEENKVGKRVYYIRSLLKVEMLQTKTQLAYAQLACSLLDRNVVLSFSLIPLL